MMTASVLVDLKKTSIKYCHLVDISDNQPLKFIFYITTSPTALKRNRSISATKCNFQKVPNMLETFSHTSTIVKVCTLHASCPTFIWHFIYMTPYIHNQYFKVKENTLLLEAISIYPNLKLFRI